MSTALVIGGSLAGMCVARVLTAHFAEVVVIERDVLPSEPAHRPGAPQSHHAHGLLERGRSELEALFPGFESAMREAGALLFDPGVAFATRRAPGWQALGPNGTELLWSSRVLLETTVRRLLRAQSGVRVLEGSTVRGLLLDAQSRVRGVRVSDREGEQRELAADLVVDASGRSSRVESWLSALGVTPPTCERVDLHAGYASRVYRAPRNRPVEMWWRGLWLEWEPPHRGRGGVIFPIENDCWFVSLVGMRDDCPPVDAEGFRRFMDGLSSPALARAVDLAEPISDVFGYRSLANVFRHYERWRNPLAGFVAIGDSVCAFNPIYGQGMSSAAACAQLLDQVLRAHPSQRRDGLEQAFFRKQADFLQTVWTLATGADFRWPHVEGERPKSVPLVSSYLRVALPELHRRPSLRRMANPVFNLTGPLSLLFAPSFATLALLSAAWSRLEHKLLGQKLPPELPPPPRADASGAPLPSWPVRAPSVK